MQPWKCTEQLALRNLQWWNTTMEHNRALDQVNTVLQTSTAYYIKCVIHSCVSISSCSYIYIHTLMYVYRPCMLSLKHSPYLHFDRNGNIGTGYVASAGQACKQLLHCMSQGTYIRVKWLCAYQCSLLSPSVDHCRARYRAHWLQQFELCTQVLVSKRATGTGFRTHLPLELDRHLPL